MLCCTIQEWCHSPISVLYVTGVAALSGTSITGEVYAWVVVFLLPVNSAINPVLYTISAIKPLDLLKKVNSSTPGISLMQHLL